MKTCNNCKWWKDAELLVQKQTCDVDKNGYAINTHKMLGYCEVVRMVPVREMWVAGSVPHEVGVPNTGLTPSDYTCNEHNELGSE